MEARQAGGQLVFFNVPTSNSEKARAFYDRVLGTQGFHRSPNQKVESYYRPIAQGVDLTITRRFSDREQVTCYFAVRNLDSALGELRKLGGELISEPQPVETPPEKEPLGRFAVMLDPDKNAIGLIELISKDAKDHFGQAS